MISDGIFAKEGDTRDIYKNGLEKISCIAVKL